MTNDAAASVFVPVELAKEDAFFPQGCFNFLESQAIGIGCAASTRNSKMANAMTRHPTVAPGVAIAGAFQAREKTNENVSAAYSTDGSRAHTINAR